MAVAEKTEVCDADEKVIEMELERLRTFKNHPFKVQADSQMIELQDSIKSFGILNPLIVRPRLEGVYEIISGHRRRYAAEQLGYCKVPVIIRALKDDEAVISMIDSNLQRERISPSERAWSLKMKMDAMRRQGSRSDLTCGTEFHKKSADERKTREVIGNESGMTGRQVTKYIRLTELVPELLSITDEKKVTLAMAVDISYFDEQVQKWVYEYLKDNGFLKPVQVTALKEYPNLANANQHMIISILNGALPTKSESAKVSLSEKKLDKYFPSHFSAKQREDVIIQLLEKWSPDQVQE